MHDKLDSSYVKSIVHSIGSTDAAKGSGRRLLASPQRKGGNVVAWPSCWTVFRIAKKTGFHQSFRERSGQKGSEVPFAPDPFDPYIKVWLSN